MNPLSGGAVARIVLSWSATPSDLDTYLTGPGIGGRFGFITSRGSCTATPFACLDVDDTNGTALKP